MVIHEYSPVGCFFQLKNMVKFALYFIFIISGKSILTFLLTYNGKQSFEKSPTGHEA
jgi:hypothetical protein